MSMSFERFVVRVNDEIAILTFSEVDYVDLPNIVDLYDEWEMGTSPKETAKKCLTEAGWEF